MRYKRVVGNVSGRGFRVQMKRLTVSRLRARFLCFFRLLSKWRWSSLSLSLCLNKKKKRSHDSHSKISHRLVSSSSSSEDLKFHNHNHNSYSYSYSYSRHQGLGRSNSFYAEAIADCLEFIKRSSISVDSSS